MDSDACPFLKDKNCSIYYTKRAYVCRLFPFNRGPFLDVGDKPRKENMFGTCGAMDPLMPLIPETYDDMVKFLSKAFPDGSFENAIQFDYITEWVNRTIVDLMKKKMLRPAINYPYEFFLKRFNNTEKIDLFCRKSERTWYPKDKIEEFVPNDILEKIKSVKEIVYLLTRLKK